MFLKKSTDKVAALVPLVAQMIYPDELVNLGYFLTTHRMQETDFLKLG